MLLDMFKYWGESPEVNEKNLEACDAITEIC